METLVIHALSRGAAQGFLAGLAGFRTKLVENDGRAEVRVALDGDREIISVLNALERHIAERREGPALLELDGRRYTLDPA